MYPSLTGPLILRPEPAGLLRLVIRREHQHDLPQHQSQPDRDHPLSVRRALAGACGKGMLPKNEYYLTTTISIRPNIGQRHKKII